MFKNWVQNKFQFDLNVFSFVLKNHSVFANIELILSLKLFMWISFWKIGQYGLFLKKLTVKVR